MSRRLNIVLDQKSFEALERRKKAHGDRCYTHTIKRAINLSFLVQEELSKGAELFLGNKSTHKVYQVIII